MMFSCFFTELCLGQLRLSGNWRKECKRAAMTTHLRKGSKCAVHVGEKKPIDSGVTSAEQIRMYMLSRGKAFDI
jgi:hypothetical protein